MYLLYAFVGHNNKKRTALMMIMMMLMMMLMIIVIIYGGGGHVEDKYHYKNSIEFDSIQFISCFNLLTPNDHYSARTAPLTSKRCILYFYSTNIGTEYFKHGIYSPFFSLQNEVSFIILTYLVPV